jgi:hypothetical protein
MRQTAGDVLVQYAISLRCSWIAMDLQLLLWHHLLLPPKRGTCVTDGPHATTTKAFFERPGTHQEATYLTPCRTGSQAVPGVGRQAPRRLQAPAHNCHRRWWLRSRPYPPILPQEARLSQHSHPGHWSVSIRDPWRRE